MTMFQNVLRSNISDVTVTRLQRSAQGTSRSWNRKIREGFSLSKDLYTVYGRCAGFGIVDCVLF